MRCRICHQPVDFGPFHAESLKRCRQFVVLALPFLAGGAVLQWLAVPIWPYWLYGIAAFVGSQALLKWHQSRWVMCRCGAGYTQLGRK